MNTKNLSNLVDDEDHFEEILNVGKRRPRKAGKHPKKMQASDVKFVNSQDDSRTTFKFTYKAARFEEWWLQLDVL